MKNLLLNVSDAPKRPLFFLIFLLFVYAPLKPAAAGEKAYRIQGAMKKYQTVSIHFEGPRLSANDRSPNPFLDYRLQVLFRAPSGREYNVAGFFNGDGKGKNSGNCWTVRFTPVEKGKYAFTARFEKGEKIAVQPLKTEGQPVDFDGTSGSFRVKRTGKNARGFHKKGVLTCSGTHYLRFSDGTYWLKGGTDSPEDFLAYKGFAGTPRATHAFASHEQDWQPGDPDWQEGKGKGIIGALNYLAGQKVNSIYLLLMNIGGDGKNVWPFLSSNINPAGDPGNDNLHYDIKKLDQWNRVFAHAQNKNIFLHFVLNEAEEPNKRELDNGKLGTERKLFYREMIARFAHHPALQWNLSEEYNLKFRLHPKTVKSFAGYIASLDPYHHPITVHHAHEVREAWEPFAGDENFCVTSFQTRDISAIEYFRNVSRKNPLVIGMDEFFPDRTNRENADRHRKEFLWPVYFSGAQIEFILDELLDTEDFRKYEPLWEYMRHARNFLIDHLPFHEMAPADDLLSGESTFEGKNGTYGGKVFAKENEIYSVYYPVAVHTGKLKVPAPGRFLQQWFNPRSGKFEGKPRKVIFEENSEFVIGSPPGDPSSDWVVLFTRKK